MNNHPSSNHPRPLFPAYRDVRRDYQYRGLQDRDPAFYQPNVQNVRLPIKQRETSYRNVQRSTALEVDSARGYLFPRYNEQVSQRGYSCESSPYDQRRDHPSAIPLGSLPSERGALRADFSNASQLQNSPRSNLYNNSSNGFPTFTQRGVSLNSYGIRMPSADLTLREKFQNHLQKEFQQLFQVKPRGSDSNYQDDYSFSPNGVLEQDRLYSNLPSPKNNQQQNELQQLSLEKASLQRSNSNYQNDYSFSADRVLEQERLYSNLPPPKNNQQSFDRDYKSIQNETEYSKITAMYNKEPPTALGKSIFSNIENSEQKSRGLYDNSEGHHALGNSPQPIDSLNQINVSLASEQNSNISSKNESFKSLEHETSKNEDMPMYSDTPITSTEKHESDSKDTVAFQFDIQKHKLLANQSVFETNSQSPVNEIARSLSFSAAQSPGFKNKNDLPATSNLEALFPENSPLLELSNPPRNSFLSKNSDSKDGSMKSFGEDSLHKPEIATKSSSSDNSLSTDDWPVSHSIPFLGETTETTPSHPLSNPTETFSIQEKSEDDSVLSSTSLNKSDENKRNKSTLEDALETLMIKEPVVGLDYIIEYKDIVSIDGGFPFHCELCKSSISRSLIIEHILGFKHRLKYLKLKDETSCAFIVNGLTKQSEKDEYVKNASERFEKTHGRGNVVVKLGPSDTKRPLQIRFGKVANNNLCSSVSNLEEHFSSRPFTIDKKENISSSVDSNHDSLYGKEHHSSSSFSSNDTDKNKSNEEANDDAILMSTYSKESSKLQFLEKSTDPDIKVTEHTTNEKESGIADLIANHSPTRSGETLTRPASPSWYGQAKKLKQEASGSVNVLHADPMLSSNKSDIDDFQRNAVSSSAQFNPKIFEQLSKCDISTDDEANSVLKIISGLMKQLLRYKLQHIASEDVENLMTSVHSKPESVDNILDLIKDKSSKFQMDKNGKLRLNSDFSVKGKENLDSINPLDSQAANCPSEVEIAEDSQTLKCNENLNFTSASQPLCNNAVQTNSAINTMPQSMNAAWLHPPPFFKWSDPNTVSTSSVTTSVSESPLQNSGMTWSSAYQMQLAAMQFYQQHGYGTGSAMYQGIPVPPCMPVTPVDASFLQLPLPPNEAFLPPPPPPANPLPKPPPPPPANRLPKPPPPPANPLPKPPPPPANPLPKPPPPPASHLPKPPLPPSISSVSNPPLPPSPSTNLPVPPPCSALPRPPPPIGAGAKHSVASSLQPPWFTSLPQT